MQDVGTILLVSASGAARRASPRSRPDESGRWRGVNALRAFPSNPSSAKPDENTTATGQPLAPRAAMVSLTGATVTAMIGISGAAGAAISR